MKLSDLLVWVPLSIVMVCLIIGAVYLMWALADEALHGDRPFGERIPKKVHVAVFGLAAMFVVGIVAQQAGW